MAAKTYKIGQNITDLKFDEKHELAIAVIDLPPPPLKQGDTGDKVTELQNALVKLHVLQSKHVTGTFDAETAKGLGEFKKDWGFKGHEDYDAATRLALAHALNGEKPASNNHGNPSKPPPPAKPPPNSDGTIRGKIVANALWGAANEPAIHYEETRPIPDLDNPHHLPLTTDCSGFATLCYKWAGAPDPNGNGYDGQGYTGTMLDHMRHIPKSDLKPGDLVVFGDAPGKHVCVVIETGSDPMLVSHGQESGPSKIRFEDEYSWQAAHGGSTVTWLTVLD